MTDYLKGGLLARIKSGRPKPVRDYSDEVNRDLDRAAIAGAITALDNLDECSATQILADSPSGRAFLTVKPGQTATRFGERAAS